MSYKAGFEFEFQKSVCKKLMNFNSFIEITENPDIVYHYTNCTDHRPDFLLLLPDQKRVLVLVVPTVKMALIYNIERFNALHSFCKNNGYGYLIMDNRGNSVFDIKNRDVDPELTSHLDSILNLQNRILWENIKAIKEFHPVSNSDIAAYVLQNKLYFTMDPFCIKRREKRNDSSSR